MIEPFTLEKLRELDKMMADIPPAPFFASWSLFPRDHALTFKFDGRDYAGAHPCLWRQFPAADRGQVNSLFAIEIIDFDIPANREKKAQFFEAMAKAMQQHTA